MYESQIWRGKPFRIREPYKRYNISICRLDSCNCKIFKMKNLHYLSINLTYLRQKVKYFTLLFKFVLFRKKAFLRLSELNFQNFCDFAFCIIFKVISRHHLILLERTCDFRSDTLIILVNYDCV